MEITFEELMARGQGSDLSIPYPFIPAYPLPIVPRPMIKINNKHLENWERLPTTKLNGNGMVFEVNLFAERGRSFFGLETELISDSFPELIHAGESFNEDVVLDGEIVAFKDAINLLSNCNDAWAENNLQRI